MIDEREEPYCGCYPRKNSVCGLEKTATDGEKRHTRNFSIWIISDFKATNMNTEQQEIA